MRLKRLSKVRLPMIYPRKVMNSYFISKIICPACQSNNIELMVLAPELEFRRKSICKTCGTTWTPRFSDVPIRYKQEFYK